MQYRYQIGAIVHGELGLDIQHGIDVPVIGAVVLTFDGKDRYFIVFYQGGRHIILGTEGIGCTQCHGGPAGFEGLHQGCGFSGHV